MQHAAETAGLPVFTSTCLSVHSSIEASRDPERQSAEPPGSWRGSFPEKFPLACSQRDAGRSVS